MRLLFDRLWGLNPQPPSVRADSCNLAIELVVQSWHQNPPSSWNICCLLLCFLRYNVALATSTLWSPSLTRVLIGCSEIEKPVWDASGRPLSKISVALKKSCQATAKGVVSHFCKEDVVTNMWTRSSASNDNYLQSCEVGRGQPAVIPCPHDGVCQADTHAGDTWPTCLLLAHVRAREGNVSGCLTLEWKGKDPVAAICSHSIGASDKFRAENHKSCIMFMR